MSSTTVLNSTVDAIVVDLSNIRVGNERRFIAKFTRKKEGFIAQNVWDFMAYMERCNFSVPIVYLLDAWVRFDDPTDRDLALLSIYEGASPDDQRKIWRTPQGVTSDAIICHLHSQMRIAAVTRDQFRDEIDKGILQSPGTLIRFEPKWLSDMGDFVLLNRCPRGLTHLNLVSLCNQDGLIPGSVLAVVQDAILTHSPIRRNVSVVPPRRPPRFTARPEPISTPVEELPSLDERLVPSPPRVPRVVVARLLALSVHARAPFVGMRISLVGRIFPDDNRLLVRWFRTTSPVELDIATYDGMDIAGSFVSVEGVLEEKNGGQWTLTSCTNVKKLDRADLLTLYPAGREQRSVLTQRFASWKVPSVLLHRAQADAGPRTSNGGVGTHDTKIGPDPSPAGSPPVNPPPRNPHIPSEHKPLGTSPEGPKQPPQLPPREPQIATAPPIRHPENEPLESPGRRWAPVLIGAFGCVAVLARIMGWI